jgi:hypothetical protein
VKLCLHSPIFCGMMLSRICPHSVVHSSAGGQLYFLSNLNLVPDILSLLMLPLDFGFRDCSTVNQESLNPQLFCWSCDS